MATLKERAEQIRDEAVAGANTATRVGGVLVDLEEAEQAAASGKFPVFSNIPVNAEVVSKMGEDDAGNWTLTNSEFTEEFAYAGSRSIKMSPPSGGQASILYLFDNPVDFRHKSLSFRMRASEQGATNIAIKTCKIKHRGTNTLYSHTAPENIRHFLPFDCWNLNPIPSRLYSNKDFNIMVTGVEIIINADGPDCEIYIDNLQIHDQPSKSAIVFMFDDAYKSVLDLAIPIANGYGHKLTISVVPDWIDAGEGELALTMTWDELLTLQSQGHEMISHGKSHLHLTGDNEYLFEQIVGSCHRLVKEGITSKSAYNIVPPGGVVDSSAILMGKKYLNSLMKEVMFSENQIHPLIGMDWHSFSRANADRGMTGVDSLLKRIEMLSEYPGICVMAAHEMYTEGEDAPSAYAMSDEAFKEVCKKARELDIPVVGISDIVDGSFLGLQQKEISIDIGERTVKRIETLQPKVPVEPLVYFDFRYTGNVAPNECSGNIESTIYNGTARYLTTPVRFKRLSANPIQLPTDKYIGDSNYSVIAIYKGAFNEADRFIFRESRTVNNNPRHIVYAHTDQRVAVRTYSEAGASNIWASADDTAPVGEFVIICAVMNFDYSETQQSATIYTYTQDTGLRATAEYIYDTIRAGDTEPQSIRILDIGAGSKDLGCEIAALGVYKRILTLNEFKAFIKYAENELKIYQ